MYKKDRVDRTLIEELRDNQALPHQEKSLDRLTDECSILLIAGSESPAKVLAIVLYHLMANPPMLCRLRKELGTATCDETLPSQSRLEKQPYLTAVMYEGLRLHSGIVARSARIAPNQLRYKEWIISAGTPMSCSSVFVYYNPEVFPEPRAFRPERWLEGTLEGERILPSLKRHLVPFGRGGRSCLGYNLGNAMLHFGIATFAGRYNLELYQTSFENVNLERDWTIPQPQVGSEGVRAMVISKATY